MSAPRKAAIGAAYVVVCVALAAAIGGVPRLGSSDGRRSDLVTVSSVTIAVTSSTSPTTPSTTTTSLAARAPGEVKVRLYNGSRTGGAAVTIGQRLIPLGFQVLAPGASTEQPAESSAIWFLPGWEAEARAVAQALQLDPGIAAPLPDPPSVKNVGTATVVVVVAEDLLTG